MRVVTGERGCGWTGWPASASHRPVCAGKVKKELDHDDGHLSLDETTKLLQDLQEAQAERGGSRPSSNLSSLSNASDRDQRHLGEAASCRVAWAAAGRALAPGVPGPGGCTEVKALGGTRSRDLGAWPEGAAGPVSGAPSCGPASLRSEGLGTLLSFCCS